MLLHNYWVTEKKDESTFFVKKMIVYSRYCFLEKKNLKWTLIVIKKMALWKFQE